MTALIALLIALPVPGQGAAHAMRLGDGDRPAERGAAFDGVGRIECLAPGGRAAVHDATGWLLGAADTVVTAAHTFYAGDADRASADLRRCVFRLYNADGSTRQTARIRYLRSPWSDPRYRNDSAYDVAVLKLDRAMAVAAIPTAALAGGGTRPVQLISYPDDATDGRARISHGEARPFPLGPARDTEHGMRASDPSRLFASSTESAGGSSGGMYYAPGSRAAIGLHIGHACGSDGCFNFGLRFDDKLLAEIADVATDMGSPAVTQLASR